MPTFLSHPTPGIYRALRIVVYYDTGGTSGESTLDASESRGSGNVGDAEGAGDTPLIKPSTREHVK